MRGLHHVKPHDLLYDMLGEEWDPAEAAWQSIIHVCPFPMLCSRRKACRRLSPRIGPSIRSPIGPATARSSIFLPGRTEYLIHDAGADPSNIVIDPGAPVGTIQVPSGVEPIVMGVDSPRIGGYARIGVVISLEMSRVGQTRPGEVTRFVRVDQNEAPDGLREQEALLLDPGIISREVWV